MGGGYMWCLWCRASLPAAAAAAPQILQDMYDRWPFFQGTVDLIEMVMAKVHLLILVVLLRVSCSEETVAHAVGHRITARVIVD
jgi:phosphoenolpyruvate carboxylase